MWALDQVWPTAPKGVAWAALVVFSLAVGFGVWNVIGLVRSKITPVTRYERTLFRAIHQGERILKEFRSLPEDEQEARLAVAMRGIQWQVRTIALMWVYGKDYADAFRAREGQAVPGDAFAVEMEDRIERLKGLFVVGPPNA